MRKRNPVISHDSKFKPLLSSVSEDWLLRTYASCFIKQSLPKNLKSDLTNNFKVLRLTSILMTTISQWTVNWTVYLCWMRRHRALPFTENRDYMLSPWQPECNGSTNPLSKPYEALFPRGILTERLSTNSGFLHEGGGETTSLAKTFGKENSQDSFSSPWRTHESPRTGKHFTFMGWSRDRYGGKLFQKVSSRVRKQGAINQGIFPGERIWVQIDSIAGQWWH